MLRYFLIGVATLLALALTLSMLVNVEPRKLARALRRLAGGILMAAAVALLARGLFVYALPLAFLGFSLFTGRLSPFASSPTAGARRSPGQQSQVRTDTIEMRLDHDTGDMDGMVRKGRHASRLLSEMSLAELFDLLAECRSQDAQAAQLLQAYLDRAHPEWREQAGEAQEEPGGAPGGQARMTLEEAYEILGLAPGAAAADIRKAHRTLMKKMHPDQGGSNYLASKINAAKDLLLGRKA